MAKLIPKGSTIVSFIYKFSNDLDGYEVMDKLTIKEVKKNNPEFVLLFLNSVAHFQHNHWNEEKNQKVFFKFFDMICLELTLLEKKFDTKLIL